MTLSYAEACWWQRLPACLAEGGHAILVTVARADGSTPRERGASMLVEATRCTDTVGGGNLEFEAIRVARAMLAGETRQPRVRYTLGRGCANAVVERSGCCMRRLRRTRRMPAPGRCAARR